MGPRGPRVKLMVKWGSQVGGGLGEPKTLVWGPLWWPQTTTKVVVVTVVSDVQSRGLPCSPLLRVVGPTDKITKIQ